MKLHISVFIVTMVLVSNALAQVDPCLNLLKDARQYSDQGYYDDAILTGNKALSECSLSKNDRIELYKLLIVNYLAIDNLEAADQSVSEILKLSPNYEPDKQRDAAAVIAIFRKYRPSIVFSAFIKGGLNYAFVNVEDTYSVIEANDADGLDNYGVLMGWQLGAGLEYRLWKNLWVRLDAQYRRSGFNHSLEDVQGLPVDYREKIDFLDINPGLRFYFGNGALQPFIGAGGQFSALFSSLGEISRGDAFDLVDRTEQRSPLYAGFWGDAGVSYRKKGVLFQLGARYVSHSANVVIPENRFDNLDVVFKYYYLDNDFSLNNLQINASIVFGIGYKNVLSDKREK